MFEHMPPLPLSTRRRRWRRLATALLVACLVVLLAAISIRQSRLAREAENRQEVGNTVRLLAANLRERLDKVDLILVTTVEQARHTRAERQSLDNLLQLIPIPAAPAMAGWSFGISNAHGRLLYYRAAHQDADQPSAPPAAIHPLLQERLQTATGDLIVVGPVQDARTQTWILLLARALELPDGSRGGVHAELPVQQFFALLGTLDLGLHSAVALRTTDLALVYRQPWPPGAQFAIGRREVSAQLREAIQIRPESGAFDARTVDHILRTNAYRRVGPYPFYVLAGIALDDFPHGWTLQDSMVVALAALTLVLGLGLLRRMRRDSRRRLDAARQRFRSIVESSSDAIISCSPELQVTSWNPAARQMFGFESHAMIGQPLGRLLPEEPADSHRDLWMQLEQYQRIQHLDTTLRHRDGSLVDVSISAAPISDLDGISLGMSLIARDITQRKAEEELIRRLAYRDMLTGLPNRRLLLDRLQQALDRSTRQHSHGALMFLDLDRFKQLNDHHGHEAGDALLIHVAVQLQKLVRASDTVARLGGDEFVVLCEMLGTSEAEALRRAEQLSRRIESELEQPARVGEVQHRGGGSVGWTLFCGSSVPADALLRAADAAMYERKKARRNERGMPLDSNFWPLTPPRPDTPASEP